MIRVKFIQLNNSNLKKILRYRKTSFNLGVLQSNSKKIVIESLRKKLGTDATSRPHLQRKEFVTELRFIRVNRFLSIHSIFVGHGSLSFSLSLCRLHNAKLPSKMATHGYYWNFSRSHGHDPVPARGLQARMRAARRGCGGRNGINGGSSSSNADFTSIIGPVNARPGYRKAGCGGFRAVCRPSGFHGLINETWGECFVDRLSEGNRCSSFFSIAKDYVSMTN